MSADIPSDLLLGYLTGQLTARALAAEVGASPEAVLRRLHALGVDTSKGRHQRRRLARQLEEENGLAPGTTWQAVAELYRRGHSLRDLAGRLGIDWQAARRLLHREGVKVRPRWHREVFHERPREQRRFGKLLRRLREGRGWSQAALGLRCGVSSVAVGRWERSTLGPSWKALYRLAAALEVSIEELGVAWPPSA